MKPKIGKVYIDLDGTAGTCIEVFKNPSNSYWAKLKWLNHPNKQKEGWMPMRILQELAVSETGILISQKKMK